MGHPFSFTLSVTQHVCRPVSGAVRQSREQTRPEPLRRRSAEADVAAGCDAGVIGVYRRAWSCEGRDMLRPSCCKDIRRAVGSQSPRPHRRRRRGGAVMGSGVRTDGGVAFGAGGDPMWGAAAQRRRRAARSADHRQQRRRRRRSSPRRRRADGGAMPAPGGACIPGGAAPASMTGGGRSAHDGTGRPRTRRNRSDRGMVGGG